LSKIIYDLEEYKVRIGQGIDLDAAIKAVLEDIQAIDAQRDALLNRYNCLKIRQSRLERKKQEYRSR
jgi:hypothetical protein